MPVGAAVTDDAVLNNATLIRRQVSIDYEVFDRDIASGISETLESIAEFIRR
jgi:hypothetical protein